MKDERTVVEMCSVLNQRVSSFAICIIRFHSLGGKVSLFGSGVVHGNGESGDR